MLKTIWIVFGILFSIVSFFPLINSPHWLFRLFDFLRLQLCAALILLLIITPFLSVSTSIIGLLTIFLIVISIVYQLSVILPYFPQSKNNYATSKHSIVALSINVKQNNQNYEKLIKIINRVQPDILLTMETNKKWEEKLEEIEDNYNSIVRVPKENRYGMHLYTKLPLKKSKVHYLISEEHPSIEVLLTDSKNDDFTFWGIHPPPPSPTEKPTSKQKDAELMKVAKFAKETNTPMLVSGDFNNVCWSKASKLFSKVSNLKDARLNRGIYSTFPAYFRILGFPIDLLFHSNSITINKIKVLTSIGSDHLPLLFTFHINNKTDTNKKLNTETKNLVIQKIKEGEEAAEVENE